MIPPSWDRLLHRRRYRGKSYDVYCEPGFGRESAFCSGATARCLLGDRRRVRRQLSGKTGIPVYDMDKHIYGSYI